MRYNQLEDTMCTCHRLCVLYILVIFHLYTVWLILSYVDNDVTLVLLVLQLRGFVEYGLEHERSQL